MNIIKILITVVIFFTWPIWIIPFFLVGGIYDSLPEIHKIIWGDEIEEQNNE
jgi:hypothetical protein